jgi:hypothetical protein
MNCAGIEFHQGDDPDDAGVRSGEEVANRSAPPGRAGRFSRNLAFFGGL